MSVLNEICQRKAGHVAAQKALVTIQELESRIQEQSPPRGFIQRINAAAQNDGPALITEIKKASPSKGLIREDFDPATIAAIYETSGAACVSVLTDAPYFQGHDDHFIAARKATSLPMIRKDFMIDPYQIYESRALGADCVLLIMAALDDSLAQDLYTLSIKLKMDVLVEVHDETELARAIEINPAMIGVNNRNLKTLDVDIETSRALAEKIPDGVTKIAESGIADPQTIASLEAVGYSGFLVGESLMRQQNIAQAVQNLREII